MQTFHDDRVLAFVNALARSVHTPLRILHQQCGSQAIFKDCLAQIRTWPDVVLQQEIDTMDIAIGYKCELLWAYLFRQYSTSVTGQAQQPVPTLMDFLRAFYNRLSKHEAMLDGNIMNQMHSSSDVLHMYQSITRDVLWAHLRARVSTLSTAQPAREPPPPASPPAAGQPWPPVDAPSGPPAAPPASAPYAPPGPATEDGPVLPDLSKLDGHALEDTRQKGVAWAQMFAALGNNQAQQQQVFLAELARHLTQDQVSFINKQSNYTASSIDSDEGDTSDSDSDSEVGRVNAQASRGQEENDSVTVVVPLHEVDP